MTVCSFYDKNDIEAHRVKNSPRIKELLDDFQYFYPGWEILEYWHTLNSGLLKRKTETYYTYEIINPINIPEYQIINGVHKESEVLAYLYGALGNKQRDNNKNE